MMDLANPQLSDTSHLVLNTNSPGPEVQMTGFDRLPLLLELNLARKLSTLPDQRMVLNSA